MDERGLNCPDLRIAKQQYGERAIQKQRGKKTLLRLTLRRRSGKKSEGVEFFGNRRFVFLFSCWYRGA